MALVSYGFGFFCAVLLLLYYIVPGRFQWRILLAASVLFYGFAGPLWILYPAASSVSVWYLARKIGSMTDQYRISTGTGYRKSSRTRRRKRRITRG